jgi:hypothetical protein
MLQKLKLALSCALLAAATGLLVQAILLVRAATEATRALPVAVVGEIQATRAALLGELRATRLDLAAQVAAARKDVLASAGGQATALQANSFQQIADIRRLVDRRLGDTLERVDVALGTVESLRLDVKPAITGAVAVESDAKDSWDDMYWDVKALVESATVAARGVAETSEAVGKAAPKLTDSAVAIGKSADGIAADVHQATTDFVKPKTFGQKFRSWLETAGKVAARFL